MVINKLKETVSLILILLFTLISVTFVLGAITFTDLDIDITGIDTKIALGYNSGLNLTNLSTRRPFFNFSIIGGNFTYNATLRVSRAGLSDYTNDTIVSNISLGGNNAAPYGNQTIYVNGTLTEGLHTFRINVSNHSYEAGQAENQNVNDSMRLSFIIDVSPPNVTFGSTTSTTNVTSLTNFIVNVTTNDTSGSYEQVSGGYTLFVLRNGTTGLCCNILNRTMIIRTVFIENAIDSKELNISQTTLNLVEGAYIYNITVNDSLGNTNYNADRLIIIDTTAPNITYQGSTLTTGTNTTFKYVSINVTTNDTSINRPASAQVSGGYTTFELHNATGLLNRTTFTRTVFAENLLDTKQINITLTTINDLTDGTYTYNATVNDTLGNQITLTSRNLIIDTTPPNITYQSPTLANNVYSKVKDVSINVTTNDTSTTTPASAQVSGGYITFELHNGSGLLNRTTFARTVFAENLLYTQNINITQAKVSDLMDGVYIYNVTVNDSLGNKITLTSRNISIDTTPPLLAITSSEGTSFELGKKSTITCSMVETNPDTLIKLTMIESLSTTDLCTGILSCSADYQPGGTGTRTASCTETDLAGFITTTTLGLTVTSSGGSGGSSSGGGGGGGGGSSSTNIITETITAFTPFEFNVANSNIGIDSISVTTNVGLSNVKITVNKLDIKPAIISQSPTKNVYKYFEINKENLENSQVNNAKIVFMVTKQWLTENNFDKTDVVLYRYNNAKWEQYTPLIKSQIGVNIIYEATIPGFSIFAVGIKEDTQKSETEQDTTTEEIMPVVVGPDYETKRVKRLMWLGIAVIIVIILVIAILLIIKSKSNKKPAAYRPK